MVKKNAVTYILEAFRERRVRYMKKWSTRSVHGSINPFTKKLIKKIRHILRVISGDDITEMCKSMYA